jgi:hypothetical protein
MMSVCASCNSPDAENVCSGCHAVHYCGKACQHAHWGTHKAPCRALRAAAAGPPPLQPPPPLFCGNCAAAVDRLSMIRCGSCALVNYCDKGCADAHWPAHKAACEVATVARVRSGDGELEGADAR